MLERVIVKGVFFSLLFYIILILKILVVTSLFGEETTGHHETIYIYIYRYSWKPIILTVCLDNISIFRSYFLFR